MEQQETISETYDFKNLKTMLESSDRENQVVALQCLENLPYEDNWMMILLLLKHANVSKDEWRNHAPELTKNFKKHGIAMDKVTTYNDILNYAKSVLASKEQIQLFIDDMNESVRKTLVDYGYTFIDKIEITLKEKEND